MIYKKLDFSEKQKRIKLLIIMIIVFIIFRIVLGGGEQQIGYYLYKIKKDRYMIIYAEICEKSDISWYIGNFRVLPAFKEKINYEVDGELHTKITRLYPDYNVKDRILVAVNKKNRDDVIRCIPYSIFENELFIFYWILLFVLIAILFNIQNMARCIQKIRNKNSYKMLQNEKENIQRKIKERDKEKQMKIIDILQSKERINAIECENILSITLDNEINTILGCNLNKDFIWCLENLHNQEEIKEILLVQCDLDGQYEFIMKTLSLREKGLPPNYYVVANEQQHFLCGREDSSRLYLFSYSLGITNTKYVNIFDYILERLNERR